MELAEWSWALWTYDAGYGCDARKKDETEYVKILTLGEQNSDLFYLDNPYFSILKVFEA